MHGTRHTELQVQKAIELKAEGYTRAAIAAQTGMHPTTVTHALQRADRQAQIAEIRARIKHETLLRAEENQRRLWGKLDVAMETDTPKTLDLLTRSIRNLEQVASSASGEALRVESTNVNVNANVEVPAEDAQAALRALLDYWGR